MDDKNVFKNDNDNEVVDVVKIQELVHKIKQLEDDNYFLKEDNEKILSLYNKEKAKNNNLKNNLNNNLRNNDDKKEIEKLNHDVIHIAELNEKLSNENKELKNELWWFKNLVEKILELRTK